MKLPPTEHGVDLQEKPLMEEIEEQEKTCSDCRRYYVRRFDKVWRSSQCKNLGMLKKSVFEPSLYQKCEPWSLLEI